MMDSHSNFAIVLVYSVLIMTEYLPLYTKLEHFSDFSIFFHYSNSLFNVRVVKTLHGQKMFPSLLGDT